MNMIRMRRRKRNRNGHKDNGQRTKLAFRFIKRKDFLLYENFHNFEIFH